MKTEFFAQIFTPTTVAGQWEAGTAYPIAKDLLITARHVLYPEQRDETKLREVEWSDYKDAAGQKFTSDITRVVFDGGKDLDIAIVACQTPPEVNNFIKLSDRDPIADEGWDSFGYPQASKNAQGKLEKIPGKGTFFQPNSNSHLLHLTSEGDAITKELWQGMSGAPVFNRSNPRQLLAVITSTPKSFNERLYAVSIPYLLRTNPAFQKAVGYLTDAQAARSQLPEVKLGEDFKKFLQQKISTELQRPEASLLNEQLASLFKFDKTLPDLITLISNSLLDCQVDEAIRDYLTLATVDCICIAGKRHNEVGDKLDLVRKVSEQILAWLVLASINEDEIQKIMPCCTAHESLFFTLGVDSFAGVEIVLSRRFGHKTAWPNKDSADPKSPYLISHQESWIKWDSKETVRKILIEIWNKVHEFSMDMSDQKGSDHELNEIQIKKLNAILRSRRIKADPEHYHIAFESPEGGSAYSENIYRDLLSRLPQLTVVQFGVKGSGSLFLIPEEYVTTEVSEFYRAINS